MHITGQSNMKQAIQTLKVTMTLIMTHMFTEFHHITFSFQNDF